MTGSEGKGGGVPPEIIALKKARASAVLAEIGALPVGGRPIAVEFGCGHGHWLTSYAEAFPEVFCLGLDLISARIRKANAKRDRRGLKNLHFIKAEAAELLAVWPESCPIATAFMLFPDPWPKKRHFKNRMIQPEFLDRLASRMTPEARFHFRTDHPDYFTWTQEHLESHAAWVIDPTVAWPWEATSYFQELMDGWQSLIAIKASHPAAR